MKKWMNCLKSSPLRVILSRGMANHYHSHKRKIAHCQCDDCLPLLERKINRWGRTPLEHGRFSDKAVSSFSPVLETIVV
jgi:hypothetical protein